MNDVFIQKIHPIYTQKLISKLPSEKHVVNNN